MGIGVTEPEQTLHVGGGATVDGTLYVSNNLNVTDTISLTEKDQTMFADFMTWIDNYNNYINYFNWFNECFSRTRQRN